MWEASALYQYIDMPQAFRVGLFLKAISRRQEKEVNLLGTLCRGASEDRVWVDESILSTNLRLANIEAQGVSHFPEWKEHIRAAVGQINMAETPVKTIQQELMELTKLSTKHNEELGMIFNSFSDYQSSLQKSIQSFIKCVDRIGASALVGKTTMTSLPEQLILERNI